MDADNYRQERVAMSADSLGLCLSNEQLGRIAEIVRTLDEAQAIVADWLQRNFA